MPSLAGAVKADRKWREKRLREAVCRFESLEQITGACGAVAMVAASIVFDRMEAFALNLGTLGAVLFALNLWFWIRLQRAREERKRDAETPADISWAYRDTKSGA